MVKNSFWYIIGPNKPSHKFYTHQTEVKNYLQNEEEKNLQILHHCLEVKQDSSGSHVWGLRA